MAQQHDLQAIPKERFYDNQLLTVDDFQRERDFHIAHRQLQTRLMYQPGCLTGLAVQAGASPGQVQVAPGVAIDGLGQQIILADSAKLDAATLPLQSGNILIDLNNAAYYSVDEDKSWLLTISFNEEVSSSPNQSNQVPLLRLIDASAPQTIDQTQIPLAKLNVHATQQPPVKPAKEGIVTVEVHVDTGARVNLALDASLIPNLSADQITSGTLSADCLPEIPAARLTGELNAQQIPGLDASKITGGQFDLQRIPALDESHIPPLDASKIATGLIEVERVPSLPASKITGQLKPEQLPPSPANEWAAQLQKVVSVSSEGNVGIRTSTPASIFSLGGAGERVTKGAKIWNSPDQFIFDSYANSDGWNRLFDIVAIGHTNGSAGGSSIRLITNPVNSNTGIERMRIDYNGNVGIGTDQPSTALHVRRDAPQVLGPVLTLMNGGGGAGASAALDFDGWRVPSGVPPTARVQSIDDGVFSSHLSFLTKKPGAPNNPLVERLRIGSDGHVGIGAPPSDALLHVAGTLRADQIQGAGAGITNLKASNIEGTLAPAQIPVLTVGQIPDLPASKITGLQTDGLQTIWAEDVTVYAQGLKLSARPRAGSAAGFIVGLLKLEVSGQTPAYALGIGFAHRLLSFTSPELAAIEKISGDFKLDVFTERTRLLSKAQFVGVDKAYGFDLLTPESQLPPASQGKIRSLVVVQPAKPLSVADSIDTLRRAVSSFSFAAVVNPTSTAPATQKEMAQQFASEKMLAAEAAPILVAQNPQINSIVSGDPPAHNGDHFQSIEQFIDFMAFHFNTSMQTPAQVAWMLGASGLPASQACAAIGRYSRDAISPQEFIEITLGAFPGAAVRETIIALQTEGASAQDAAAALKGSNPAFDRYPLQFGVLLRINFYDTANTPLAIAQAWKNAGYPSTDELPGRLAELFPLTDNAEIASALRQAYGS